MKRRQFIRLLGGAAAAWPLAARAQRPDIRSSGCSAASHRPMRSSSCRPFTRASVRPAWSRAARSPLSTAGGGPCEQLPALADQLIRRGVTVSPRSAARLLRWQQMGRPRRFRSCSRSAVVPSLRHRRRPDPPGGRSAGVSFYTAPVVAKRFELARELVLPGANIGLRVNPCHRPSATEGKAVEAAAAAIGQPFHIFNASTGSQIDDAFAAMASLSPRRGAILTTACIRAWQQGARNAVLVPQFSPYTAAMPIRPYLDKYRFARTSYLSGAMLITNSIAWRS